MANLKQIVEDNFRIYAGAVLQSRALVDVRDCLKPSARQIFYCLYTDKFTPNKPFHKVAKVIGSTTRLHAHDDVSAQGIIMRAGQPFSFRYPLMEIRGSYGNLMASGNWAAPRYCSARLSNLSLSLFQDIEKDTIKEWRNSYDDTELYPSVFPSKGFYNIVNGTFGIGVGAASSIPPFNLREVNEALIKLLWNPDIDFEEIYCAPDFPTGGFLLNEDDVKESLKTGSGKSCKLRSLVEYDSKERVFTVKEIPYGVYTNTICRNQLEELLDSEDNPGIDRFNDLTGENSLIKIYLTRSANPDKVLKYLYKKTSLQNHYAINLTMLENGRFPKVFSWKEALQSYITHQIEVYKRGFEFDLQKAKDRLHIVEGILIALARIEEVIETIKSSSTTADASKNLQKKYLLSEIQAKAILAIRLARLANLEVEKFKQEKESLLKEILRIETILKDSVLLKKEIEKDLIDVAERFGDARRTKILNLNLDNEEDEVIETKALLVSLTNYNNVFVQESSTLYTQKRGGVGSKFTLANGEYIISTLSTETNQTLLLFSNNGNFYQYKLNNLPFQEKTSLTGLLELPVGEQISAMTALNLKNTEKYIMFITKKGFLKKSYLSEYNLTRSTGVKALNLANDDQIVSIMFLNDEKISLMSKEGRFIIIETKGIRPIGRVARGVAGMKLDKGDEVVSGRIIEEESKEVVSVSQDGLIKRTNLEEVNVTGRNTKGVMLQGLREEDLMVDFLPLKDERELVVTSGKAKLKMNINNISISGRGAIGVTALKLKNKDKVIGISKF